MTYDYTRIEPLSTAVGAEIGGVDLAALLPRWLRSAMPLANTASFSSATRSLPPSSTSPLPGASAASTSTASLRPCLVIL